MSAVQSFRSIVGAQPTPASVTDSTLIIIDAQNEYGEGKLKVSGSEESRKVIKSLLDKYRKGDGRNIVHVVHETPQGAPVFTPSTRLAEEFDELKPRDNEKVVTKHFPSSFAQTDLDEYLTSLGDRGKKIVLVGYMAHVCVSTTTRAGAERGYSVVIPRDAIGDRDIPGADADTLVKVVLAELADAFATVVDAADIE